MTFYRPFYSPKANISSHSIPGSSKTTASLTVGRLHECSFRWALVARFQPVQSKSSNSAPQLRAWHVSGNELSLRPTSRITWGDDSFALGVHSRKSSTYFMFYFFLPRLISISVCWNWFAWFNFPNFQLVELAPHSRNIQVVVQSFISNWLNVVRIFDGHFRSLLITSLPFCKWNSAIFRTAPQPGNRCWCTHTFMRIIHDCQLRRSAA